MGLTPLEQLGEILERTEEVMDVSWDDVVLLEWFARAYLDLVARGETVDSFIEEIPELGGSIPVVEVPKAGRYVVIPIEKIEEVENGE